MSIANGYADRTEIKRQRSMKFSLYPTDRPQTSSSPTGPGASSPVSPVAPQIPPLPLSARDLLPMNQQRPFTSHHTSPVEGTRSFSNQSQYNSHILREKPSEASRLRALNNGYRAQSSDGSPESTPIENFSRPRQPSVRRRKESPNPHMHHAATYPNQEQPANQERSRDRGFSTSSSASSTQVPAYPLRPSMSIPDYQTPDSIYTRQRNLNSSTYKPSRGGSRPESNYSIHRREHAPRGAGLEGNEIRASFRSALTTNSSFLGTSGTERSSVMTKSSSATSIYGRDEGMSVDDAIGMYEMGFTDDGLEDHYENSRPGTAMSEEYERGAGEGVMITEKEKMAVEDAMSGMLLVPPSHVQIRDSTSIFKFNGRESPNPQSGGGLEVKEPHFEPRTSSRPVTPVVPEPTIFDGTRDRYGFRKKTQYVPLPQYEAWSGPYTEYLARRRKKWVVLMKDSGLPSEEPTEFPSRSNRVKRFVRKGIPPDWRGAAWFYYAGGPAMVSNHPGIYADLVAKAADGGVSETDDEIIERDLNRTFPDNVRFKPDPPPGEVRDSQRIEPETPILQSLRRVLQAFSIYNPRIGYCQSLNFLAGMLLLFMDEEKSFWMLNIITRVYLPGTHDLTLEGSNVDLGVLMAAVKDSMAAVWGKIGGELDGSTGTTSSLRLPPITLCLTPWFMSCFIGTLPTESVLRVWDSFFFEGSKTLFRVALTVFKLGEAEIKAVTDPMEIFQVVQGIPRRMIDCNSLMEACFFKRTRGLGITQETIEKGRAERRRGYAEERERLAAGLGANTSALGRKGTVKKGTLFGRKGR